MPKGDPPLTPEQLNNARVLAGIPNEGSLRFWVNDPNMNWATSSDTYVWPPISKGGITVTYKKLPNKTIEVSIAGPFGKQYTFNAPIPKIETSKGLMVTLVWKRPSVVLHLNGRVAQTLEA